MKTTKGAVMPLTIGEQIDVLVIRVPDARKASLMTLLAEDRQDCLRARVVVAVDDRRIHVVKNNLGEHVLKVVYRVAGAPAKAV